MFIWISNKAVINMDNVLVVEEFNENWLDIITASGEFVRIKVDSSEEALSLIEAAVEHSKP